MDGGAARWMQAAASDIVAPGSDTQRVMLNAGRLGWQERSAVMAISSQRMLAMALLLLAAVPAAAQQPAAPSLERALERGTQEVRLTQDGVARTYVVHLPARPGPLPLVVMLHGAGGRARQTLENYRWD